MSGVASGIIDFDAHRQEPLLATGDIGRLAHIAAELLRLRHTRAEVFDADIFSEPGWNILLDLFVCWSRGQNCSVSDLCIASAAPATTALRWLVKLDAMGLVARASDGEDRRRSLVFLSPRGRQKMIDYLSRVSPTVR